MHRDSPTWCSIVHRSEHESQVWHHSRSTYFSSDPSDRPSIDGVTVSSTSETVSFWMNVPKPFPSDLGCEIRVASELGQNTIVSHFGRVHVWLAQAPDLAITIIQVLQLL